MYLSLGNGETVRLSDVIGIFDMDTATVSSVTRAYLSAVQKRKELKSGETLPKSFLLLDNRNNKKKKYMVVLAGLSALALRKRAEDNEL